VAEPHEAARTSPDFTRLMKAGTWPTERSRGACGARPRSRRRAAARRARPRPRPWPSTGRSAELPDAAHRAGAAVLLVVGVQDEQDVERAAEDRARIVARLGHAEEHAQEVAREAEVVCREGRTAPPRR